MSRPEPIVYTTSWSIQYDDNYYDSSRETGECHYKANITYKAKVNDKIDRKYESHIASSFDKAKKWIEKELDITI